MQLSRDVGDLTGNLGAGAFFECREGARIGTLILNLMLQVLEGQFVEFEVALIGIDEVGREHRVVVRE